VCRNVWGWTLSYRGVREGLVGKKPEEWEGISQAAVSKENSRQRKNTRKALRWIIPAI